MGNAEVHRGRRPRLKHRIEHVVAKRLLRWLAARPVGEALERGAGLGRLWHAVDSRHRGLARGNIRLALGVDERAAARTARECFEHLGRTLAEFAISGTRVEELFARFSLEGVGYLRAALSLGRGVFLLSGHCGNWELFGARLSREVPLIGLARPMSNPLVDDEVAALRAGAGQRPVEARNAVREVFRILRRNEAVGVLLDQNALRHERVFVGFFGRPASTNCGLAMMALKSGAPVLPVFSARGEGGHHRGWIGPPIEPWTDGDRAERIGRTTARYTAAIEGQVRRHPAQWFWVHNRWKRSPEPGEVVWLP